MRIPIAFLALSGICMAADSSAVRQLHEDNRNIQNSINNIYFQQMFAELDRWEEAHPYTPPQPPLLGLTSRDYNNNEITIKDYEARYARYAERCKKKTQAQADKSMEDTMRCYPQYLDKNSPLHVKAKELWDKIKDDPENPLCKNPDNTFILYEMAANILGIKPVMSREDLNKK